MSPALAMVSDRQSPIGSSSLDWSVMTPSCDRSLSFEKSSFSATNLKPTVSEHSLLSCIKCQSLGLECDLQKPMCTRCKLNQTPCTFVGVRPVAKAPSPSPVTAPAGAPAPPPSPAAPLSSASAPTLSKPAGTPEPVKRVFGWDCPVIGCDLSFKSRDSLNKHSQRKHPHFDRKMLTDTAAKYRRQAILCTSVDESIHSSKPRKDRPAPQRKSLKNCSEYWPCMAPGCLKFFVSRHALLNHRYQAHKGCQWTEEPKPYPKGTPHPMAVFFPQEMPIIEPTAHPPSVANPAVSPHGQMTMQAPPHSLFLAQPPEYEPLPSIYSFLPHQAPLYMPPQLPSLSVDILPDFSSLASKSTNVRPHFISH
jgi:hypothetical protein